MKPNVHVMREYWDEHLNEVVLQFMIRFVHVSKVYDDQTIAVKDFNLEVARGELVALIGPSGCGKTTTLKMVNRLHEPTEGSIHINGVDISKEDPVEIRRNIGYVIQQVGLFPHMTVAQNIALVPELQGWSEEKRETRVEELLELVNMDPEQYRDRYPAQLSGGQQQRIGVMRALAADPDIILMDEPFGALDPLTRNQLQDELLHMQAQLRKTILLVTHDMEEAMKLANRIVIMRQGELLQVGTPEEILRHPANDFVAEFVGAGASLHSSLEVTVRDVMTVDYARTDADKGLAEALRTMKNKRVDHLIVLENGAFAGVISALDLHPYLSQGRRVPVRDVMRREMRTVGPNAPIQQVALLVNRTRPGFVPVVTEDGCVLGVVRRSDLVDVLVEGVWNTECEPMSVLDANANMSFGEVASS